MSSGHSSCQAIRVVSTDEAASALRDLLHAYVATWYDSDSEWPDEDRELVSQAPLGFRPPDGQAWLAYVGAEPVGCVLLRGVDSAQAEILKLFVLEEFRNRGLARQLMTTALGHASQNGYCVAILSVASDRVPALSLYYQLGFTASVAPSPPGMISLRYPLQAAPAAD